MKLLELFSLSTGLKIDKPFIYKAFYPLPFDKYITIHPSSGMASKNYTFWDDVLELLKPTLEENNIRVVQIGSQGDEPLKGCYHLLGATNIQQTAYILSNTLGHLSNDTFSAHMVGSFNKPLVTVYGSTTIKNHSPYFYNSDTSTFIEANRNGRCASYMSEELPKTVDSISPEIISNAFLKLFGKSVDRNSLYFGQFYPTYIIEFIPDHIITPDYLSNGIINVRMDYLFNEALLTKILYSRKVNILSDKPIDINIIRSFKSRVNKFSYEVNVDTDPEYVRQVKETGVDLGLFTKEQDVEKLTNIRMKLFDFEVIQETVTSKETLDFKEKLGYNTSFKTNKFILSKDGVFLSKAHWLAKQPVKGFDDNTQNIIDSPVFWEELDYFYIFNQK